MKANLWKLCRSLSEKDFYEILDGFGMSGLKGAEEDKLKKIELPIRFVLEFLNWESSCCFSSVSPKIDRGREIRYDREIRLFFIWCAKNFKSKKNIEFISTGPNGSNRRNYLKSLEPSYIILQAIKLAEGFANELVTLEEWKFMQKIVMAAKERVSQEYINRNKALSGNADKEYVLLAYTEIIEKAYQPNMAFAMANLWDYSRGHPLPPHYKKEIERMLDCIEFGERYEI